MNLQVRANIWIDSENPAYSEAQAIKGIHKAKQHIPGDLMIEFFKKEYPHMNPRDRSLVSKMTEKQQEEYGCYRFFYFHGQTGTAFDPS